MKTTKIFLLKKRMALTAVFVFAIIVFVGATTITGKVTNESKTPLNYATATLINPVTKMIVQGDMCDSNGDFILEDIEPGEYILCFRIVGYQNIQTGIIKITGQMDYLNIHQIMMIESKNVLKELKVVASRKNTQTVKAITSNNS